jgi:TPR repeat protein
MSIVKENYIPAMNNLGNIYWKLKDYDNAIKYFRKSLDNNLSKK